MCPGPLGPRHNKIRRPLREVLGGITDGPFNIISVSSPHRTSHVVTAYVVRKRLLTPQWYMHRSRTHNMSHTHTHSVNRATRVRYCIVTSVPITRATTPRMPRTCVRMHPSVSNHEATTGRHACHTTAVQEVYGQDGLGTLEPERHTTMPLCDHDSHERAHGMECSESLTHDS